MSGPGFDANSERKAFWSNHSFRVQFGRFVRQVGEARNGDCDTKLPGRNTVWSGDLVLFPLGRWLLAFKLAWDKDGGPIYEILRVSEIEASKRSDFETDLRHRDRIARR